MAKTSFKKGTAAAEKRSEIADAIHEKHPEYSMEKKMKIATAAVKRSKGKGHRFGRPI